MHVSSTTRHLMHTHPLTTSSPWDQLILRSMLSQELAKLMWISVVLYIPPLEDCIRPSVGNITWTRVWHRIYRWTDDVLSIFVTPYICLWNYKWKDLSVLVEWRKATILHQMRPRMTRFPIYLYTYHPPTKIIEGIAPWKHTNKAFHFKKALKYI